MRPNRIPIAQIVAGFGVAVAIGAAPVAAAENHQSCGGVSGSIQCQTPGNVQIVDSPVVQVPGDFPGDYGRNLEQDRGHG
jgi:hypothetical protein